MFHFPQNVFKSSVDFRPQSGFTLVELLVVIAIIAILGVVAIAAINPAARIASARDQQALANVQELGKVLESCIVSQMTDGLTQAAAITSCCTNPGTTSPYGCTSSATTGLGGAGFGYATSFPPANVTVNRTISTSTTPTICVSQRGGTTSPAVFWAKYVTSGGTVVTNATADCNAGS